MVTVGGLPAGAEANVVVSGPADFSRSLTTSAQLDDLVPGTYVVTAAQVLTSLSTFDAVTPVQMVVLQVSADGSPTPVEVTYRVTTGSLNVIIAGLPPGVSGSVVITGPDAFIDTVVTSQALGHLTPGVYAVESKEVRAGSSLFSPKPASFTVAVAASVSPAQAVIGYTLASGSLSVLVNGLPAGAVAAISMTGPNGFSRQIGGSETLDGLLEGRYVLAASDVVAGATTYGSQPGMQAVMIAAGAASGVTVNYSPLDAPGFDLLVDAVEVQQVVQTPGEAVPLVAGKDGLLRVFARATQATAVRPVVRIRLYDGTTIVDSADIAAPAAGVPTAIVEGDLNASWNHLIPAALMKPGLRVQAEIDPDHAITESSESDNLYPSTGSPLALDVRTLPSLALRLVPVTQSATGLTGDVSTANLPGYLSLMERIFPVDHVAADIRAPYTTSAPALQANDANGAWLQILSEIDALRLVDGSAAHYYGVVKTGYATGIIGLGSVPGSAAVGWDVFPSAGETIAHELGHNLGRFHSPCGASNALDPDYPYHDGSIGVFGYDITVAELRVPSTPDIMGYCANRWISDYNYVGMMAFLGAHASSPPLAAHSGTARPGLLVFGHVADGTVVLEPAYDVVAPPALPRAPGPNRLEVLDSAGARLADLSFAGNPIPDELHPGALTFAFVIPVDTVARAAPRMIRVQSGGRAASAMAAPAASWPPDFVPRAQRLSANEVRVTWPDAPGRGVLLRDAQTGEVLAFGRGGSALIRLRGERVDATLSDGVRSARRQLLVRQKGPAR